LNVCSRAREGMDSSGGHGVPTLMEVGTAAT